MRRWQENLFFILWDTATRHGFMVHLQRIPALGWQEAQAVVSIGGTLGSATLRRPFLPDAGVAEVTMTPVEPWRDVAPPGRLRRHRRPWAARVRVHRAGRRRRRCRPTSPSAATSPPPTSARACATWSRPSHADPSGPQMTHAEHYEQGGTWTGTPAHRRPRRCRPAACSSATTRGVRATSRTTSRPSGRRRASTRAGCSATPSASPRASGSSASAPSSTSAASASPPRSSPTYAPEAGRAQPTTAASALRRRHRPRARAPPPRSTSRCSSPTPGRAGTTTTPSRRSRWTAGRASA